MPTDPNIGTTNPGPSFMASPTGSVTSSTASHPDFSDIFSNANILAGEGQTQLEAYIRQLFGENGGTIGQEVAAGRMTPDQAVAMLVQAGYSSQQAIEMVRTGMLNIPLLTIPGDIETRLGPRGGQRALAGPYAIERSLASQEVVRQAALIKAKALQAAMAYQAATGGGRGGGGGGGEMPPRPPLPPIPIPSQPKAPPWYSQAIGPATTALGAIGVAGLGKLFGRPDRPESPMSYGSREHPTGYFPQGGVPKPPSPPSWSQPQGQQGQGYGYQSPGGYDYSAQQPQDQYYGYQSPGGYDYSDQDYGYQSPSGYDYSYNPTPNDWQPPADDWSGGQDTYDWGDYL